MPANYSFITNPLLRHRLLISNTALLLTVSIVTQEFFMNQVIYLVGLVVVVLAVLSFVGIR